VTVVAVDRSVPLVGKVTLVVPVRVRVQLYAPEVVRLPPSVIVLPVFATPVPPYWPDIAVPSQVPLVIVPVVSPAE